MGWGSQQPEAWEFICLKIDLYHLNTIESDGYKNIYISIIK